MSGAEWGWGGGLGTLAQTPSSLGESIRQDLEDLDGTENIPPQSVVSTFLWEFKIPDTSFTHLFFSIYALATVLQPRTLASER